MEGKTDWRRGERMSLRLCARRKKRKAASIEVYRNGRIHSNTHFLQPCHAIFISSMYTALEVVKSGLATEISGAHKTATKPTLACTSHITSPSRGAATRLSSGYCARLSPRRPGFDPRRCHSRTWGPRLDDAVGQRVLWKRLTLQGMVVETTGNSAKEILKPILDFPVEEGCSYSNTRYSDIDRLQHVLDEGTGLVIDEERERATLLQAGSGEWLERRRKMLTASKFGRICRRRINAICKTLVKTIMYSPDVLSVPALQKETSRIEMKLL
ncbi:hypothetical protein PR048_022539 [Dryococelus australis]|uniref:Uncharacterized protein n=1 Tax=Dryococelus australis TaxID=614101 RepID=A0ABQ9H1C3_9NEOP|nr:hypothetical protein PR048_022539 [Dryococelus australis]